MQMAQGSKPAIKINFLFISVAVAEWRLLTNGHPLPDGVPLHSETNEREIWFGKISKLFSTRWRPITQQLEKIRLDGAHRRDIAAKALQRHPRD